MQYLSIGFDKGSIIVPVDTCQRCMWRGAQWWTWNLWQHPMTGKVHKVARYRDQRTECGQRILIASQVIDKHIAVAVS